MRRSTLWIAAAIVAAPLCTSAVAQQQPANPDPYAQGAGMGYPAAQPRPAAPGTMGTMATAPIAGMDILVGADSIIGAKVRDVSGQELGQVKQLMVRPEDGRVQYAILALGGVLGVGGQQVAVPWQSLRVTRDEKTVVVTAERQVLTQAPKYDQGTDARVDANDKAKENR